MESAVFAEGGSLKSYRKWILVFVLLLAVGAGGFLLGRETAPDSTTSTLSWMQCDTIYVTILEKQDGNYFHVKGLSVNDVNGQGEYSFSLEDDAKLVWRGTEITAADFGMGVDELFQDESRNLPDSLGNACESYTGKLS